MSCGHLCEAEAPTEPEGEKAMQRGGCPAGAGVFIYDITDILKMCKPFFCHTGKICVA